MNQKEPAVESTALKIRLARNSISNVVCSDWCDSCRICLMWKTIFVVFAHLFCVICVFRSSFFFFYIICQISKRNHFHAHCQCKTKRSNKRKKKFHLILRNWSNFTILTILHGHNNWPLIFIIYLFLVLPFALNLIRYLISEKLLAICQSANVDDLILENCSHILDKRLRMGRCVLAVYYEIQTIYFVLWLASVSSVLPVNQNRRLKKRNRAKCSHRLSMVCVCFFFLGWPRMK